MKIRFGECECCAVLKDEIRFLRSLASPKPEPKRDVLPRITFEADGIISGQDHQTDFEMNPKVDEVAREVISERDRILSGNY